MKDGIEYKKNCFRYCSISRFLAKFLTSSANNSPARESRSEWSRASRTMDLLHISLSGEQNQSLHRENITNSWLVLDSTTRTLTNGILLKKYVTRKRRAAIRQ